MLVVLQKSSKSQGLGGAGLSHPYRAEPMSGTTTSFRL